ncbi:MAG: ubiquinone/menaquinone biosynthesis methyltransferase [Deltaproteobacteria bacterium]|nr:ubiquinone/menaquinone biosynthesis methyltransferase [Deltaproteobacteria bacterium]
MVFFSAKTKTDPALLDRQEPGALKIMFSGLARRYDLVNRILSLGRDIFWRRALARRLKILAPPGRLLDLGAGTGDLIVAAKKIWPGLDVTGLDLAPDMLALARPKLAGLPVPAPALVTGNALDLPFGEADFDSVSIAFGLRSISRRRELYAQVRRVLKPGGRFLILELFHDPRSPWAGLTSFYLRRIVPNLGGRILTRSREAYRYLSDSIMAFPQPARLAGELAEAGFTAIAGRLYTFDSALLVWGDKPGQSS